MRRISAMFLAGLVCCVLANNSRAQQTSLHPASRSISYQGVLQNGGQNLPDGTYPMRFTLYSDPAGTMPVWQGAYDVAVTGGVFNVLLGSGDSPLPNSEEMDGQLYLGVKFGEAKELPVSPISASPLALNVADSSITAKKIATPYVSSVSVNGEPMTGIGTGINIIGTNGITAAIDPGTNNLILSSTGGTNSGKKGSGDSILGSSSIIGTENEVLANGTYGTAQSGNVTVTTPQAIATTSSPTFAALTLTSKATSAATASSDASTTLTTKGYVDNAGSTETSRAEAAEATKLPLAGGTMTGSINMGTHSITNMADPVNTSDAATKHYVDNAITTGALVAGTGINISGTTISNTGVTSIDGHTGAYTLASGDIPNNAANTTGSAQTITGNITEGQVTNLTTDLSNKEAKFTAGNLTSTTSGVTITGGTGATVDGGATVNIATATGSQNGLLSSTDWNTFNTKQNAIPANTYDAYGAAATAQANAIAHFTSGTGINVAAGGQISNTGVTAFNTRTGNVTLTAADVNAVGAITNSTSGTAQTITGSISESQVTNLTSDLNGKEPTVAAGTTSQYYRGDKTWQTLNAGAIGGLGTMATQNANNVAISGGSISGTAITGVYYSSGSAAAVTIPATAAMVEIGDPGGPSHIVTITLPAVNNGQVIHIHNGAMAPTAGAIVIPPDGLFTVMATGGNWVISRN